ncbi:ABC transporter permease [Lactiplantibacillus plantarum]|uniref:ABC transporter permease n=1 Tax=Lactiplantibacillus plantarum TaxID=1590 RepID=UPI003C168776
MITSIRLELYKFKKQKHVNVVLCGTIVFYFLMVALTIFKPGYFEKKLMVENSFSTLQFLPLIIMIFASELMSAEFRLGTIKNLIVTSKSRLQIIASKFIFLLIIILSLFLGILLLDIFISFFIFQESIQSTIMKYTLLWVFGTAIETLLLGSLVFFLSIIFKNPAIPVTIGVLVYLLVGLVDGMNFHLISKLKFLRWNVLNLLNFKAQLIDHSLQNYTKLSLTDFSIGISLYIIFFLMTSYVVFRDKTI